MECRRGHNGHDRSPNPDNAFALRLLLLLVAKVKGATFAEVTAEEQYSAEYQKLKQYWRGWNTAEEEHEHVQVE